MPKACSGRATSVSAVLTAVWPIAKWVIERRDKRQGLEKRVAELEEQLKQLQQAADGVGHE